MCNGRITGSDKATVKPPKARYCPGCGGRAVFDAKVTDTFFCYTCEKCGASSVLTAMNNFKGAIDE